MPAYRNRMWDGKIRLYNQTTGQIPAGLFPQILSFAESREYELEVEETEYGNPNEGNSINVDFMMKFIEALKLPFDIRAYSLMQYVMVYNIVMLYYFHLQVQVNR